MSKSKTSDIQQQRAYTEIINFTINYEKPIVTDLTKDLQDGVILSRYLEIESCKKIEGIIKTPLTQQDREKNMNTIVDFLKGEKIKVTTSVEEVLRGEFKPTITLLFYIMYRYRLNDVPVRIIDFSRWFRFVLKITNPLFDLKSEFGDGTLFARFINSFRANAITANMFTKDKVKNCNTCLNIAKELLNIPPLLIPQYVSDIDDNTLVLYLSYFVTKETRFGSQDMKVVEKIHAGRREAIKQKRKDLQMLLNSELEVVTALCDKNTDMSIADKVKKIKTNAENMEEGLEMVDVSDDVYDETPNDAVIQELKMTREKVANLKIEALGLVKEEIKSPEPQNLGATEENEKLRNEVKIRSTKIEELEKAVELMKEKKESAEKAEREMRVKLQGENTLMGIIQEFERSVKDLNMRIKEKNDAIDQMETTIDDMKEDGEVKEQMMKDLKNELLEMTEKEKKMKEITEKEMKSQNEKTENDKQQEESDKSKIKQLQNEIETIKKSAEDNLKKVMQNVNLERESWTKEKAEFIIKVNTFEEEKAQNKNIEEKNLKTIEELTKKFEQLEIEKKVVEQNEEHIKQDYEKFKNGSNKKIQEIEEENMRMKDEAKHHQILQSQMEVMKMKESGESELEKVLQNEKATNIHLQGELENMKKEVEFFKTSTNELKKDNAEIIANKNQLLSEIEDIKKRNESLEKEGKNQKFVCEKLTKEIEISKTQSVKDSIERDTLTTKIKEALAQVEIEQAKTSEAIKQLTESQKMCSLINDQLLSERKKNDELRVLKEECESMKKKREDEIDTLGNEVKEKTISLKELSVEQKS
ncbi:sarcolemmal membrane-associated protein, putative [Entamoeba invadens IP1]|uniref:Sarcolemmal membrane-associated protein, putative n=1 Tax=Entamoeba invadens IP1 TaxID=370355 RepID=A0A0A1U488_ENTIV|nr:sarcolemmal membrane-associated protein, putative [Entamoeba invadens IP1]ELP89037.1 sarcolemmal membrane-associated protein, putative [Entamoeba invadens IP1]|eukprot:XP_004255808.1 sarcolemmal membrane-associated protein, putative [Entamoeba invadens IP1]